MITAQTAKNPAHEYALSLLGWVVQEPINGRTDYYVVAAFETSYSARKYADWMNEHDPLHEYGYEVAEVGTLTNQHGM